MKVGGPGRERQARWLLQVAAGAVALGLAIAGTLSRDAGGALTAAGWGLGLLGLHRFGRLGRDLG